MSPTAKMPGRARLELLGVGRDRGSRADSAPSRRPARASSSARRTAACRRRRCRSISPLSLRTVSAESWPVLALDRRHLTEDEIHLAAVDQRPHGVNGMRRGAEGVAAMDQRDPARDRMKVRTPVERRIAAADDNDPTAAEMLHLADGIEDAACSRTRRGRRSAASSAGTTRRRRR